MRIRHLFGAICVAGLLATATPTVHTYSVQWYSGYWYPYWWNPFTWCSWSMWVDDYGNYDYEDSCGGSSSYFGLN